MNQLKRWRKKSRNKGSGPAGKIEIFITVKQSVMPGLLLLPLGE
jgi:hypothetical protein